jgi:predicted nucleic acid-binding protein
LVIAIDASVAVKWYVIEPHTDLAIAFYAKNQGDLIAPDVFTVEVVADSEKSIVNFLQVLESGLVQTQRTSAEQAAAAATLAMDIGHPLKDCLYLALAMELGCDLVTCDARFAEKAQGVWDRVRVLGA